MKTQTRTLKLTRGAIMVALACVLSVFAVFSVPYGGSVTIGSMVPVLLFSLMYNVKWGLFCSLTYGVMQIVLGFYPPPTHSLGDFVLVVLLDYIVAFGCLGLAGAIYRRFKSKMAGIVVSTVTVVMIRFLCHFASGIIIWHSYATIQPVWLYSLVYNGSYMGPELLISTVIVIVMAKLMLNPAFQKKLAIEF